MEHFEQEKVDLIYYQMIKNNRNNMLYDAFRKNGFISVLFAKGMRLVAYSSAPDTPKEFLQDSRNWLAHYGDSDAI